MGEFDEKLKKQLKDLSARASEWKGRGLSEADTKRNLIEPLLEELGWSIYDPGEVRSDYSIAGGRVDYALMIAERIEMLVEAKALGGLAATDARQLLSYGASGGVRWCLLADGSTYELYDNSNPGPLPDKLVFRASIEQVADGSDSPMWSRLVKRFSLLSKAAIAGGHMCERAAEIRAEEEIQEQRAIAVGALPQAEEGEARRSVAEYAPNLVALYNLLRSKIRESIPQLRARPASRARSCRGWVAFENSGTGKLAGFNLTMVPTKGEISIWFPGKIKPPQPEIKEKGLRTTTARDGMVTVWINQAADIDDTLMNWLANAA